MATIEELDFKLIVDDKDFNKTIKDVTKKATDFNTDVSKLLDLKVKIDKQSISNFNSEISKLSKSLGKLNVNVKVSGATAKNIQNQQAINTGMQKYIDLVTLATQEYQKLNQQRAAGLGMTQQQLQQIISQINAITGVNGGGASGSSRSSILGGSGILSNVVSMLGTYFSITTVKSFISNLISITGEFEKQRIALGAMIGDMSTASRIFEQIKDLAVQSPFQVKELVTFAKQLAAYSIPVNELYDTTKMLADVSAGLGVDMERIILAYGQIRSANFLRGQEVRQLTEAGIPILQELSKQISEFEGRAVSVSEVFDRISSRQVTFDMVKKVFTDMTSEGGKFYQMQEVLAETLSGKVSNLADAWQISMDRIGRSNSSVLGAGVDLAKFFAQNLDEIVRVLGSMIVALGAVGLSLVNWGKLLTLLKSKTAIIFYIGTAISWVISKTIELTRANKDLKESLDIADKYILKFQTDIATEDNKLRSLIKALNSAKLGTQEYENAKNNILSAYDAQLSAIDRENLAIGKTIGLYDSLKDKIVEATKAKYNEEAITELKSTYELSVNSYLKDFQKWRNSIQGGIFSDAAFNQLRDYISGTIEYGNLNEETIKLIEFANKQRKEEEQSLQSTIKNASTEGDRFGGAGLNNVMSLAYQYQTINIELMRNGFKQAYDAYQAGIDKLNDNFFPKKEELDSMRKLVAEIVDPKKNLAWGANESWYEFVDRIREQYAKNREDIKLQSKLVDATKTAISQGKATEVDYNEKKAVLDRLNEEQKLIEELNRKFGFGLGEDKKSNSGAKKDEILQQIQEIQKIISVLRKLRSASEELKNLYPDWTQEQINSKLASVYSFDTPYISDDYNKEIEKYINKAKALASDPKISDSERMALINIAQGYESDVWRQYIKDMTDAKKATEDFNNELERFTPTTKLNGVGLEFDISNAIKTYEDGLKKIKQEYDKLFKTIKEGDKNESESKIIALDSAKQKRTLNEWQKFLDKMNELGKKGFTEMTNNFGIPDGETSKMNPFQRIKLRRNLRRFVSMEFDPNMPELREMREQLISQGLGGDELEQALRQFFEGRKLKAKQLLDQLETTKIDDARKIAGYAAKGLSELSSAMKQYAEASGDSRLKKGAEILGGISELAQGFAQGGFVGLIATGVKLAVQTIVQEMSYMARLENMIEKARQNAQIEKWDEQMDTDSIFGTNQVKQMKEAEKVMDEISAKYKELYKTLSNQSLSEDSVQGLMTAFTSLQLPFQGLFGAAKEARKQIQAYYDAIAKGYRGIEAYIVKYNDRGGLANWFGYSDDYTNLKDLFEGLGYEMYDRYGNLNAKGLQAILNTYERLGDEDRQWMEEALGYSEEYEEAMEKINEVMQDLYGGYVSDIVDSMIDKWVTLGAVTADYAEALSDVAKNYAKMAIQSAILENVFTQEFEDKLREATINMNAQEVMGLFEQAQSQIEEMTPFIAQILDYLDQYFINDSSSDSISNGIKSITEETASLLASYVNAIRADVSVTRNNVGIISSDLKLMLGLLPSAPNLAEYLTQIQANTYNTQMATENILGELRAVIGTESGMTAVRVSM